MTNQSQTAAIASAIELLGAETFEARGLHIYRDDGTRERYIVDNDAMETLGHMLADKTPDAYAEWCNATNAIEVEVEAIVRDSSITEDTDLDALQAEAGAADDMVTYMALAFLRDDVEEIVRTNAEKQL